MSEKKQKIKTSLKKDIGKNAIKSKEKPVVVPIVQNRLPSPDTKKIIKTFVETLLEENKTNTTNIDNSNSFSPPTDNQIKNEIKEKENLPIKIKMNDKTKELELNKLDKKDRSKSLEKIKKNNNNSMYKRNNLNIINKNNIKKKNKSSVNIYTHSEKKENKNHRRIIQTEQPFKTPCNRESIGNKMIRDEIEKEKKMCAEKIKIIKEHILSLKKKEEELAKKMMQLNYKENALSRKNLQNEELKEKEISKPQNQIIKNN